jgi:hypothetical protein
VLSFRPTENILIKTRTQDSFRRYGLCSCNILAEINNFGLGAVILSCLVSELQKTSSPGIEPRTVFQGFDLCFCNLLFETNNFCLGAVLLSCLVSELQEPPSPRIKLRTLPEFWPSYVLFLVSRNKNAKFGANRFIPSRAIVREKINRQTYNFIFMYLITYWLRSIGSSARLSASLNKQLLVLSYIPISISSFLMPHS